MVTEYYGLKEQPFGVTPDSRYLYASATHREALASLLYGIEVRRGFMALIAKPGMGKTTLLFHALNQLQERAKTVFLYQTIHTPVDFLQAVLADLGVHQTPSSLLELQSKLNEVVTEQSRSGKPLILVIYEAQSLDDSVLEMVRMLSNFETSREKLIQIVLSGQPQLADKLASPNLVQLRQRVSIVACLKPFSPEETALYIEHRLRVAGYNPNVPLFTADALSLIAANSGGIPRNINNLCFNALSVGRALKRKTLDCEIVREVMADLDLEPLRAKSQIAQQPPQQNSLQGAPQFVSSERSSSLAKGWPGKLAMVCAVLIVVSGSLFQGRRWMTSKATTEARNEMPSHSADNEPQSSGAQALPVRDISTVRVTEGQTLYLICVQSFGSCNAELIQKIQTLNPWLRDINHIESGQTIRLPVIQDGAGLKHVLVEQSENSSTTKRATP